MYATMIHTFYSGCHYSSDVLIHLNIFSLFLYRQYLIHFPLLKFHHL